MSKQLHTLRLPEQHVAEEVKRPSQLLYDSNILMNFSHVSCFEYSRATWTTICRFYRMFSR